MVLLVVELGGGGGAGEPGKEKTIELRKKRVILFIINEAGLLFSFFIN